jgi:hypothetical protein
MQELSELIESPPAGISVQLADESDLYAWKVLMQGPEDTPYQVRKFGPSMEQTCSLNPIERILHKNIPGDKVYNYREAHSS